MDVFSLAAKITLDTNEYETALGDASTETHSFGEMLKNGLATAAKVGAAGLAAATTAVGALSKAVLESYGDYEQLTGGVETLFKTSADVVMEYANNAYQTAGLSANQYMETVTSFSASLLQSLGGDTEAAAEYANTAITDMSDNANKMGTAMDSIQNAYQGFAKQNFTMLDNLKLGYGGTKEEMERLLADAEKISGIEYDISSYADIVDAIHVVQTEMGITGTTALEASTTIQGSVSAAKSAWANLVAGLGNENADLDQLVGNLVTSVETAAGNILPRITQILSGMGTAITQIAPVIVAEVPSLITSVLPSMVSGGAQLLTGLITGLISAIPGLISAVPEIISSITTAVSDNLPAILRSGDQLLRMLKKGIFEGIPQLIDIGIEFVDYLSSGLSSEIPEFLSNALPMILSFSEMLRANFGKIVDAGIDLILSIVQGIANGLPTLIEYIPTIVSNIAGLINDNAPKILKAGIDIIVTLGNGLIDAIPALVENIPQIITAIVDVITAFQWFDLGKNIIDFFANGIKSMIGFVKTSATNIRGSVVEALKDLPKTLLDLGKKIFTDFGSAIESMKTWVIEKVTGIASGIIATLKSLPGQALQIGKDLITGIWNGITSKVEWLKSQVTGVVDTIKGWFTGKDGFDEHSPSKWANQVFRYVMEGGGEGLEAGLPGLMGNVSDVVGQFKSGMSFGTTEVDFASSAVGQSSAAIVNSVGGGDSGNTPAIQLTIDLLTGNGAEFARWILPDLIAAADAAGTPITSGQYA